MAMLYRDYGSGKEVADMLTRKGVPFQWQQDKKRSFEPLHDSVKLITMHSSKGLEFPMVCIPAMGALKDEESLKDEAQLLYVAMTRATQELVMTHHGESVLSENMRKAIGVL